MKSFNIFLLVVFFLLLTPAPADAYIDPGTGSLIIQLLIGGIVSFFVVIKLYWQKISSVFRVGKRKEKKEENLD